MSQASAKMLPLLSLIISLPLLAGCASGAAVGLGLEGVTMVVTNPRDKPAADLSLQTAQHENWCYQTMGDPQCYVHPQPGTASTLINVDPPSSYPLTAHAYDEVVIETRAPQMQGVAPPISPVIVVPQ